MRAEADLTERATNIQSGTLRHQVVRAAQRFRAGWADLGKLLVRVREEGSWEEWGYPSFEGYCLKELHLRRNTVEKLTRSFSFLARREPEVASSEELSTKAPPFEVVEVLADAESRGVLEEDAYQDVRRAIWGDEARTPAQLKREVTQRFPKPPPEPPEIEAQLKRLAAAAHRLSAELGACERVPPAIVERAAAVAQDVRELAEEAGGTSDN